VLTTTRSTELLAAVLAARQLSAPQSLVANSGC
jgi:hypothetical protein